MTSRLAAPILGVLLAAGSSWTWAHHNTTAKYDAENPITITGTVVQFRMINPHSEIDLEVTDDQGKKVTWFVEAGASSVMYRRGWRTDDLKPGDVVTVIGRPAYDGSPDMSMNRLETADGKVLEYR
jgi:DNA/RNA endonuclease YhcR with UshA esterase domain